MFCSSLAFSLINSINECIKNVDLDASFHIEKKKKKIKRREICNGYGLMGLHLLAFSAIHMLLDWKVRNTFFKIESTTENYLSFYFESSFFFFFFLFCSFVSMCTGLNSKHTHFRPSICQFDVRQKV